MLILASTFFKFINFKRNLKKENFSVDNAYCPNCHKKLIYSYYHYGHIGSYYCPNCDFKRGNPNFTAKNVNLKNGTCEINQHSIHLNQRFLFTVYATTASYALCKTIGLSEKKILNTFNSGVIPMKRGKELFLKDRPVMMLESKNENALSYYQSLKYIYQRQQILILSHTGIKDNRL